jgi:hypothetical protein
MGGGPFIGFTGYAEENCVTNHQAESGERHCQRH